MRCVFTAVIPSMASLKALMGLQRSLARVKADIKVIRVERVTQVRQPETSGPRLPAGPGEALPHKYSWTTQIPEFASLQTRLRELPTPTITGRPRPTHPARSVFAAQGQAAEEAVSTGRLVLEQPPCSKSTWTKTRNGGTTPPRASACSRPFLPELPGPRVFISVHSLPDR